MGVLETKVIQMAWRLNKIMVRIDQIEQKEWSNVLSEPDSNYVPPTTILCECSLPYTLYKDTTVLQCKYILPIPYIFYIKPTNLMFEAVIVHIKQ